MTTAGSGPPTDIITRSEGGEPSSRARRRDSLENADKVLAAAIEVCSERGLAVTLPEVAARAGVGRATVYRSFTSRDDLIAEVMAIRLKEFSGLIVGIAHEEDAWVAIRRVLTLLMSVARTDRLVADACILRPDLLEAKPRTYLLPELIARAQQQGSVRPGVTEGDIRLLVSGLAHSLSVTGQHEPEVWERAAGLIAHAIKADSWRP